MSLTKKLWIGIGVLIVLSPVGVVFPKLLGAGGAWGEWGLQEVKKVAGFVPEGMKRIGERWKAPLPNYSLPGKDEGLASLSIGYVVAAVIGVVFVAGLMYLLTKLLVRKNGTK